MKKESLIKIPNEISKDVIDFCNDICPGSQPLFVKVEKAEKSETLNCFVNVRKYAKKHSGHMQHGWSIYEIPGKILEAEFHCVYKSTKGDLIDISPNLLKKDKVLFLPDKKIVYEGYQIDNIRKALDEDPLIKELITISEKVFKKLSKDGLRFQYGAVSANPELIELMQEKFRIIKKLEDELLDN